MSFKCFFLSKIIIKYIYCIFALLLISIYPPPKRVLVLGTSTKCAYVEVLFWSVRTLCFFLTFPHRKRNESWEEEFLIEIPILIPVSHHSGHRRVLWIHHYCKNKNAAAEIYVLINDLLFSFNNELHLRQQEKIDGNIETRVSYQSRWKKLCRRKIKAEMYGLSRRRSIVMAIIWPRWQLKFFPTTLATSGRHNLAWLLSW